MLVILRIFLRRLEFIAFRRSAFFYWLLLGSAALTSFAAGMVGWWYWQMDSATSEYVLRHEGDQNWQAILESIQLSAKAILASDIYDATSLKVMPPSLQIARVAGSLAFILMIGRIFLFALGGRASQVFLWARTNHDIVIGDHELAFEYVQISPRTVTHVSRKGIGAESLMYTGDILYDLSKVGAKRANRIIVAHQSDVETWSESQKIAHDFPKMEVLAHITNPWLLERVSKADPATHIKPFSFTTGVARDVMLAHPPFLLARRLGANSQHIIIIGFADLGQALLREFLVTSVSLNPSKLAITIIDVDARRLAAEFYARHPEVGAVVDLSFIAGDLAHKSDTVEKFLAQRCKDLPPCAVYVAMEDHQHPLVCAVAIKDRAEREQWFEAPIFVNSREGAGLKQVVQGAGILGLANSGVEYQDNLVSELKLIPFGAWDRGMDGTALLSSDYDALARTFHESYIKTQEKVSASISMEKNWDYLDEEYRVANRRVAGHLRSTLDAAGFDLNSWLEGNSAGHYYRRCDEIPNDASVFDLDDKMEMEKLAELQHERWVLDRLLNGWSYGPIRNNKTRKHNHLVKYEQLSEDIKEHDRAMVRQIARLVGQQNKYDKKR